MKRFYEELEAKKDWKKELQTYLSASSDDFNFSSPDRRFLEDPFYLPNLQDIEKLEDVVIAVDTSGSISTWQFNHFISEVKEIQEDRKSIQEMTQSFLSKVSITISNGNPRDSH